MRIDRPALEIMIAAHQAELYRYLRYLGADRSTAEDLLQETFLAAYRVGNCRDEVTSRGAAAWLRVIARNRYLDLCRRRQREPIQADAASLERAEVVWNKEFLHEGDGFDYVEALRRCVEDLPGKQREAIDLAYSRGASRSELARVLHMTEDGVKSLLRRLRAALRQCVNRRLASERPGWSPATNTTD